jgi:hypothetical protein
MKTRKTSRLAIRLPEEEMEQIQLNARAMDKTVSAYVREISRNFCVFKYDYESILQHAHEITYLRNAINQLIYTIRKTGEYVPADLEFILYKMYQISKSEKEFVSFMLDDRDKKTKAISREVRKIVRGELSK